MPLHPEFTRTYTNSPPSAVPIVWLPFTDTGVLCEETNDLIKLLEETPERREYEALLPLTLGTLDGTTYRACEVTDVAPELRVQDLRALYGKIPMQQWLIVGYATQILHWRKTSGFCPVCGAGMGPMGHEWVRKCTGCGHERYPQVSPALLILVHDGEDRILMAHKPGWGDRYSIFAGFVLPGESLEECVHREVAEEAGVTVCDLVYAGSQPWPFPHQLMIGFRARYIFGDIEIDRDELDDARWFSAEEMPALPGQLSLSRQMIEAWLEERHLK